MAYVRKIARIGSSAFLVPLPKMDSPGNSLSRAKAWNNFAEPMMPMRAEKKVTAHSPARTIGADRFVREMMLSFARKESREMVQAMERITTK